MSRASRAIGDTLLTAGSALVLVLALVLVDDRVREQISTVFDPRHPTEALAGVTWRVGQVTAIVIAAARTQSFEHAPLVIFAVAAAILTIFMLRT